MPMPTSPTPSASDSVPRAAIATIDRELLAGVAGGTSRVTARSGSDDQLQTMLSQITSSISQLASNKNQSDPTQMLLMMMMMGGLGGGGGGYVAQPAAAAAPVVNVDTSVLGGRGGYRPGCGSKKGW
jgi:hypothetical protein